MSDAYGFLSSDGYPDEGTNPLVKQATLTEFLLARIAEDEADPWRGADIVGAGECVGADEHAELEEKRRAWEGRSLARCAADRRIVEEYLAHVRHYESRVADGWPAGAVQREAMIPRRAVESLADIYADHEDFDESWRP